MKKIWQKLKKPIFAQSPMEDVTDTVFRQIIAKCGKPDVFFTEFTNVEGLCSRGRDKVGRRLIFSPIEKPIIAQIWGLNPEKFYEASKIISKMGFAGIDINMGCPEKSVVKKGAGGKLIDNPDLAKEIILAVKKGADGLPVSVKTRIGVKEIQTEKWIRFLLEQNLDCITVHGRTVKEQSEAPNHWDEIGKAVKIRNEMKLKTLIIGNGDIQTRKNAFEKIEKYKLDGIMIGRGIFNNLWIFNKENIDPTKISYENKLELLIEHLVLFDKTWGKKPESPKGSKNFSLMKKFYRIYISGHPNAKELRMKLMELNTIKNTLAFLKSL